MGAFDLAGEMVVAGEEAKPALPTLLASTAEPLRGMAAEDSLESLLEADHKYTEEERRMLRNAKRRWTDRRQKSDLAIKRAEYCALVEETRRQMLTGASFVGGHMPANRYGAEAALPRFDSGRHVPTLALINPHSGAGAGNDILKVARTMPYYQNRFFNIIDVVKDQRRGGLLDVFREELIIARDEAKARGLRPRVVSGGGDGTASFALFVIFAALRADSSRGFDGLIDAGNGFIWSDEEMEEGFPALAQMPLGSANDFGHTLGWGHQYPGSEAKPSVSCGRSSSTGAAAGLFRWIEAVINPTAQLANFDVWGIMPPEGEASCDFKLCELGGERGRDPKAVIDGKKQLVMKQAGTPVPLFACLYFSAGFGAYMTARFQINRRQKPSHNKLEYVRQAAGILTETVPPQLNPGLEGVSVSCGNQPYFPPRSSHGSDEGRRYREVGFLNINWQAGMCHGADRARPLERVFQKRQPAKFNDGMMDMYRLKTTSALKSPGLQYQTDKTAGPLRLTFKGGKGKGLFFQWDGEARFAFSPTGDAFNIDIRKILVIPVVLGPGYDARLTGECDKGDKVSFQVIGEKPSQRVEVQQRILKCVRGELDSELNASRNDILAAGFHCNDR